ncbi:pterin-4-alpha-carbinolamine dehydratase 2, mitochondrial isoform X2 [Oryza brachyantha]|uniref:pterin-4-alpha-carbinolamine dehydratase 2, mitochondrial isoform X2 n=1 Tax=Oryza brachyantha TaxID=4533 RepID=UPI000776A946|nr:pterin-4-alpha-carbinolamine dehydratase 2, mitochondrial isoform X2 [Oryza brachyantha]
MPFWTAAPSCCRQRARRTFPASAPPPFCPQPRREATARAAAPSLMIRAAALTHSRLLLARSYAMAASSRPSFCRNLPLLGHVRSHYLACARQDADEIKMSRRRWCHGSSDNQELARRSCVPCNSKDIHAMSEDSAKKLLEQVGGWELAADGDILKLHRAWKVKNFVKGLEFLQLVAAIAEEEGHHPDLHLVSWNNVKIDVWTHSVKGLTDNDFILAAKINNLNLEGLLSKKANVQN